jgi:hypothetical protein
MKFSSCIPSMFLSVTFLLSITMPRPITREGLETRLAIRTAYEQNTALSIADLRRQFGVMQPMVDSAMGKTAAEWQDLLDATPARELEPERDPSQPKTTSGVPAPATDPVQSKVVMPGLEQGIVKFMRKPAKMGEDYIFWIPRVYIRNGLVDPSIEYEVYLKKK